MSIWTNKPPLGSQINWGHPLSRGLVGCWLMNEGGGLPFSQSRKQASLKNAYFPIWGLGSFGKGLHTAGVDNNWGVYNLPNDVKANTNNFTLVVRYKLLAILGAYAGIVFTRTGISATGLDFLD